MRVEQEVGQARGSATPSPWPAGSRTQTVFSGPFSRRLTRWAGGPRRASRRGPNRSQDRPETPGGHAPKGRARVLLKQALLDGLGPVVYHPEPRAGRFGRRLRRRLLSESLDLEPKLARDLPRAEPRASLARGLVAATRPRQWSKNLLLYFGLVFALKLFDFRLLAVATAGFLVFCAVSASVYLVNDLADLERDRLHPVKRNRPLAAGIVKPGQAVALAVVLLALAIPAAFWLRPSFGLLTVGYLALSLAYSFRLKHVVIVDVFAVAAGFVVRAAAGAVVVDVPISPWLYVCTVLAALFVGLSKRRHELVLLEGSAANHRRILEEYSPQLLDQLITVVVASTAMAYSLYTFSAENLPRNHAMMLTIPFVLYGLFRYLFLVYVRNGGGSPEEVLLKDVPFLANALLWMGSAVAVLYFFRG